MHYKSHYRSTQLPLLLPPRKKKGSYTPDSYHKNVVSLNLSIEQLVLKRLEQKKALQLSIPRETGPVTLRLCQKKFSNRLTNHGISTNKK